MSLYKYIELTLHNTLPKTAPDYYSKGFLRRVFQAGLSGGKNSFVI
jgi:hypothetical protein